jgi:hypothetical protein
MNQEANPPSCRCNGTGAYTAEIAVSDAVVLVRRICVAHIGRRALVRERSRPARVGEVMDTSETSDGTRVYLRPPGGGLEWEADPEALEPVENPA